MPFTPLLQQTSVSGGRGKYWALRTGELLASCRADPSGRASRKRRMTKRSVNSVSRKSATRCAAALPAFCHASWKAGLRSAGSSASRPMSSAGSASTARVRHLKRSGQAPSGLTCQWAAGRTLRRYCLSRLLTTCPATVMTKSGARISSVRGAARTRSDVPMNPFSPIEAERFARCSQTITACPFPAARLRDFSRAGAGRLWPQIIMTRFAFRHSFRMSGVRKAMRLCSRTKLRTSGRAGADISKSGSVMGTLMWTGPKPLWVSSARASLMSLLQYQRLSASWGSGRVTSFLM